MTIGVIGRLRERFQASLSFGTGHAVVSNSGTTLCTTCAALDFRKILRDGLPREKLVCLGTFSDMTNKSDNCAFCRLVVDLVRRRWRLDDFPDADVGDTDCYISARGWGPFVPDTDERKASHRLFIHASRPPDISSALIAANAALYLDIQLLEEDSRKVARSKDLHGRRVKDRVDIHLIKKWIKLCERTHGEVCEDVWWKPERDDLPELVRMVDVVQMALIHAGRGCRFVALSYVWGGPGKDYCTTAANVKARYCRSGFEESALPATIVDAIQLTHQLGERYLWVDALCIIQDSQEDKAAQISIMDQVYGRAALTIIVASGTNVRAGLPGLKEGTRVLNQHIECVQGLHLSIPLPSPPEAFVDSTWNTRGWTFQESVLSRRKLYFTQHQVYFECSKGVWCEDLVAESETLQGSSRPTPLMGTSLFLLDPQQTTTMNHRGYENAVEQYTRRHLTVESDIIDAITALTNAMTRVLEPAGSNPKEIFRFGMWIRILDLSLLWQPVLNAVHTRRTTTHAEHSRWPSWAWSGWKGAAQYQIESHMINGSEFDVHPLPAESLVTTWNLVDESGAIVRLDVERIPPSWNVEVNPDDDPPPKKYVPLQSHPNDLVLDFLPPSGTLIFRTQRGPFRVSKLDDSALSDPKIATAHAIFHVFPVDQLEASPRYAGRVILPVTIPSWTVLEFVVLSRCDGLLGLWDESVWGKGYYGCMLHIMAVRRMRDDSRISERIGIGSIVESAWMKSEAEEHVVLLA